MAFEKFVRTTSRGSKSFASHYTNNGSINISSSAVRVFKLDTFQGVILYYSCEANKIGLEFTNDLEAAGFKKISCRRSSLIISGQAFMRHFKLLSFKRKSFRMVKDSFFEVCLN